MSNMPQLREPIKKFLIKNLDLERLQHERLREICRLECGPNACRKEKRRSSQRKSHHKPSVIQRPVSPRLIYELERADIEQAIARFDRAVVEQEQARLDQQKLIADQCEAKARQMEPEAKIERLRSEQARRVQDQERWRETARRQFEMQNHRDGRTRQPSVQRSQVVYEWPQRSEARAREDAHLSQRQTSNPEEHHGINSNIQRPSIQEKDEIRQPLSRALSLSRGQVERSVR